LHSLTVSRNLLVNRIRKKKIQISDADIDTLPEEVLGNIEPAENRESAERILHILNGLPEKHRVIINLFFIEGNSHGEIANMLGIKDSSSRSRLTRAIQRLRETIYQTEISVRYEGG